MPHNAIPLQSVTTHYLHQTLLNGTHTKQSKTLQHPHRTMLDHNDAGPHSTLPLLCKTVHKQNRTYTSHNITLLDFTSQLLYHTIQYISKLNSNFTILYLAKQYLYITPPNDSDTSLFKYTAYTGQ